MNSHEFFLKYSHSGFERKRLKRIENPDTTKVKVIHLKAPNCDKVRIVGSTHQHPAHLISANNKTLVDLNGYYTRRWLSGAGHRYMVASDPSEAVNILAPTFHDEFDDNRNDHYIYIADAEVAKQTIYKLKLDSISQIKVCAKVDNKLYLFKTLKVQRFFESKLQTSHKKKEVILMVYLLARLDRTRLRIFSRTSL